MSKMFKKLGPADMALLRAIAMDDDDAISDAVLAGANTEILVSREFLDKLRASELLRFRVAGLEAKYLIDLIRDGARP